MLFRFEGALDDGRDVARREQGRSAVQFVEHRLERRHLFGLVGLDLDDAGDAGSVADEDPDVSMHPADMTDALEVSSQGAELAFELRQEDRRSGRAVIIRLLRLEPLRDGIVARVGGPDAQVGERCLDPLERFDGLGDRGFGHFISSVTGKLHEKQGRKARTL